ncbi:hypothetical protein EVAR_84497_1 [Eumeta japonica]|uniref:Uncharacterized protein n=1 Tax=Eumeta variegata TaxID=151549 RepID=A0A4C1UHZ1_EUMVA|nr:hypothetical protein EVAR_84497_1 [Eumeta japonica]
MALDYSAPSSEEITLEERFLLQQTDGLGKLSRFELEFVCGSFTSLFLRVQMRNEGLMLPHAQASSRRGYDLDGLVVIAPFRGSKLENYRASWRSRGVVSGCTDIILDRHGRLWE